jgi:cytochrome c biogenesis protein CcmG, thiol:disulfide interchange protein DsbE
MTGKARSSRREAARSRQQAKRPNWLLPAIGGGVILVAAVAAIALSGGMSGEAASTPPPSAATGSGGDELAPVIAGTSLPAFEEVAGDAAVGAPIPTIEGSDFAGRPVSIADDGRPKVLLFLAHWCSHCQAEVPLVQDWVDSGDAPTDVDLISIATGIDAGAPNYPPEDWLAREGWTVPVIVDRTNTVADAYGLTAFPFWVFVDAEGNVTGRLTGELPIRDLETIIDGL